MRLPCPGTPVGLTTIDAPWRGSNYLQGFKNGYLAILNSGKKWPLFKLSVVYIEASFTIKNTGEHKTIEVKINEDLIPRGVAKFLTRRYGEITGLCFHFTRETND